MKPSSKISDENVEAEISRLLNSPEVQLAKREEAIRYRRRQYLYKLRGYERRGMELMASSITMEMLETADEPVVC